VNDPGRAEPPEPEDRDPQGDAPGGAPRAGEPVAAAEPAGGWRQRTAIVRPAIAWGLVAALTGWLAVRISGVGAGTSVETFIVFTPYVALASVVGLVVVALLRVRTALVAAGACCAGYALVMAPLFVPGPRPSEAPTGPDLGVMTVNVQFGWADAERVVELVDRGDVELLGVQELTPEFHERLLAAGLDDRLPHAVVDARAGAAGTGLYSRHPLARTDDDVAGRHENPTARIRVRGAPRVEVTVVHPVPPVGAGGRADWRATFRTLPRPGRDATAHVLLGDFNATLDQPTMRDLLEDGYVDAADAEGRAWVATWRSRFPLRLAIDHILVDRSIGVDQVTVHGIDGSDHRAIAAHLRLPAAPEE
jgi:endonuclease/exonuclease/phosphatase family metal-dependent hydrolase